MLYVRFPFRLGMSKISFMGVVSKSVMKLCGFGGADLVRCLRLRSARLGQSDAILLKLAVASGRGFRENQRRDALFVACRGSRRRSAGELCHKAPRSQAALKFLGNSMKRYGQPQIVVTDKLRSYGATIEVIGNPCRQQTSRWLNNRAENFHLPLRRRDRAMLSIRQMRCLQKSCCRSLFRSEPFQSGTPPLLA